MRKTRSVLILVAVATILVLVLPLSAYAAQITAAYPSFSAENLAAFQLNGNAYSRGSALRLTDASGGEAGSAFWKQRVSLADNRSFSTEFTFQMLNGSNPPADGLCFVIQPGTNTACTQGGGLGFGGIPNSLGIEFDTWRNSEYGDPNANHVGIDLDGSVYSISTASPPFTMSSGVVNYAWVDYDGPTHSLSVRLSNTATRPASPLMTYDLDLAANFGPDVYVGFTGSTGGSWESHDVLSWYFNNDYVPGSLDPGTTTYTMGPATIDVTPSASHVELGNSTPVAIVAKDAQGNLLPNVILTVSAPDGGSVTPQSVVTDNDGQATVTFTGPDTAVKARVLAAASGGLTGEGKITVGQMPLPHVVNSPGNKQIYWDSGDYVDMDLSIADADQITMAQVRVSDFQLYAESMWSYNPGPLSQSWDSQSGVLTISGAGTVSEYETALRFVYYGGAPDATTRDVEYKLFDGSDWGTPSVKTVAIARQNEAPIIQGEQWFSTLQNTQLVVEAPGLLTGVYDPEGDPLSVTAYQPDYGSIDANPDGSFTYTPPPDFYGGDYFYWEVSDDHGNTTGAWAYVDVTPGGPSDTTPPTTSIFGVPSGWANGDVPLTLTASDPDDEVSTTYYSLDGSMPEIYGLPFTVTGDGHHTVQYWSVDSNGNNESAQSADVYIDSTAPTSQASGFSEAQWSDDVTFSLAGDDALSGLEALKYSIDGGSEQTYDGPVHVSKDGVTSLSYWAVDVAGNAETPNSATIRVDKSAPTDLSCSATGTWRKTPENVTLSATDAESGIGSFSHTLNGGAASGGSTFTVSAEGTTSIDYTVTDGVGNTAHGTARVRIDRAAPYTTADNKGYYFHDMTMHFSADDVESGVADTKWRLDGGTWTSGTQAVVSTTGNHTLDFYSVDALGNKESTRSASFYVDPLTRTPETSSRIIYEGAWATSPNPERVDGDWLYTTSPYGAANVSFTGTTVRWIVSKGTFYGKARVILDGGPAEIVDLYSPVWLHQQVGYARTNLSNTAHTLRIECANEKDPASTGTVIGIDAIDVLGTLTQASSPLIRAEETDSRFVWEGSSASSANAARSGGAWRYMSSAGAAMDVAFSGTQVRWIASKSPTYGKALVSLDGGTPEVVDLYSSDWLNQQIAYGKTGLPAGPHTLRISYAGDKNPASSGTVVGVDAIDLIGNFTQASSPWVRAEETDSRIAWEGVWASSANAARSAGAWRYTSSTQGAADVAFTGTDVRLVASMAPTYGRAIVSLDQRAPQVVDLYSTDWLNQQIVFSATGLTAGPHTLRICCAGAKTPASSGTVIGIDAVDVVGSFTQASVQ